MNKTSGIYIHIPFCLKKCFYCDFYSITKYNKKIIFKFIKSLKNEIFLRKTEYKGKVDSIYFGGGTPSILQPDFFAEIISILKDSFDIKDDTEITTELNPEDVSEEFIQELKGSGINRVSLGIQTLSDDTLNLINRRHTSRKAKKSAEICVNFFSNTSFDLMLGLPLRSKKKLTEEIKILTDYNPSHLSIYSLHLSEHSPLLKILKDKKLKLPDTTDEYLTTVELLDKLGFKQYEISNWAKEGKRCIHNLHYWNLDPFLGFGPSASGTLYNIRKTNTPDLLSYIQNLTKFTLPSHQIEVLSKEQQKNEYIMMRLRLTDGVVFSEYHKKTGFNFLEEFKEKISEFTELGYGRIKKNSFSLTTKGFLVSNYIISSFFN